MHIPRALRRLALVVLAGLTVTGCDSSSQKANQQGSAPPPTVIVDVVEKKDIVNEAQFTGRIEAIDKVQLRARVQGFLKKRNFVEGAEVKKGEILFEVEPDTYEIAVAQAKANLASARAALTLAQQTFERTSDLAQRNVTSKANLDTARSQLSQAQAAVQAQETALQTAELNLSYTRITAPMDGRVGRTTYSVGNLVGPSSEPLVTIVAQDPMYVTFPVPQRVLLAVRRNGQDADDVKVKLRLSDGSTYGESGRIKFADVQATASTDSVTVRATIPNPDRLLVDQQLVDVRVIRDRPDSKLVMPQPALVLDQQGAYALAVNGKDTVEIKRITLGEQQGPLVVVTSGLKPGDRVIVSGHQKARPGMVVKPTLNKAAENGDGKSGSPTSDASGASSDKPNADAGSDTGKSASGKPEKSAPQ